jgi:PKD domain-containing protein
MGTSPLRRLSVILGALTLAACWVGTATAAPPGNDNFAQATPIDDLPFSDSADLTEAGTEPGEPQPCYFSNQTAWYSFTPATDMIMQADTIGSGAFYSNVSVLRAAGPGIGNLFFEGCAPLGNVATFTAHAGTTYYFQTALLFGSTGVVELNVREVPPPPNDDFGAATPITAVPYSNAQSAMAATKESGEPNPSCAPGAPSNSWWYAFTPGTTQSYQARLSSNTWSTIALYTGSSLNDLNQVECRSGGGAALAFTGTAATTYYIQVSDVYGSANPITLDLDVAPPPNAGFNVYPSDPSTFDTVSFIGLSSDPAGNPITSELYDFGDGTSAEGCCPNMIGGPADATHRYAKDGDYVAKVTATTSDGRTATSSMTIHVRTHDVVIQKLTVPQTAHAGQTRSITVGLGNRRYTESVQVDLMKSVSGGDFVSVGVLTHDAVVGKTTAFAFNYVFTADDAAVGKVTFKVVATIVGARDAQPADNTVISLPTKVSR